MTTVIFPTLENFLLTLGTKVINKRTLEALIKGGAMDDFSIPREQLLANIENMSKFSKSASDQKSDIQDSLFGDAEATQPELNLKKASPVSPLEILQWEKELLGMYLSAHPLENIKVRGAKKIGELTPESGKVKLAGQITKARVILTKKGDQMGFFTLEDLTGSIELTVFPQTFKKYEELLKEEAILIVDGKIESRNDNIQLIVDTAKPIEPNQKSEDIFTIELPSSADNNFMLKLKEIFKKHPGNTELRVRVGTHEKTAQSKINTSEELKNELKNIGVKIL